MNASREEREQDEEFRFTFLSNYLKQDVARGAEAHQGKCRWDTPADNITAEDWARHKAQLERHEPFYEMQRPDAAGHPLGDGLRRRRRRAVGGAQGGAPCYFYSAGEMTSPPPE